MYIVLILVMFFAVAAYVLMNQNSEGEQAMAPEGGSAPASGLNQAFAYLSRGKLFLKSPDADAQEVHSEYVQQLLDKRRGQCVHQPLDNQHQPKGQEQRFDHCPTGASDTPVSDRR